MDLTSFGIDNKKINIDNKNSIKEETNNKKQTKTKENNIKQKNSKNNNNNNNQENIEIKFNDEKNLNIDFTEFTSNFIKKDEKFLPWFLKYQIKEYEDLIITSELKKIEKFFTEYKKGKGLFLIGPAGCGKTTTLYLFGKHFGYEIFEINASDSRSKKSINEIFGDVINQKSIFNQKKLIIVDEVDGISGTKDRGGSSEIVKFVKESNYPIVFTANEYDSDKIKPIKKISTVIDFKNHSYELLINLAKKILTKEKITYKNEDLEKFVEDREISDIRAFINDLQASIYNNEFLIDDNLHIRDYKKEINELLDKIYFSYPQDSYFESFNTNINLDDLFLYLEENTPKVFSKKDLFSAFNEISKADVQKGRIMHWQYWRFLVYINFYLTYGISQSKSEKVKKITYKKNERILKKWIYSNKFSSLKPRTQIQKKANEKEKFIEVLSKKFKRSVDKLRKEDLYYYAFIYQNDKEFAEKQKTQIKEIDLSVDKSLNELK